jgi:hypothetical protein
MDYPTLDYPTLDYLYLFYELTADHFEQKLQLYNKQ